MSEAEPATQAGLLDAPPQEAVLHAAFEHADEFFDMLSTFLSKDLTQHGSRDDEDAEIALLLKLDLILNNYQEQSYLLDPTLERIIGPAVEVFRNYARNVVEGSVAQSPFSGRTRVELLSTYIHHVVKTRGYKTIIRFFPHEVSDLSIAVGYLILLREQTTTWIWPLRSTLLLWLTLIIVIPFDLTRFDEEGASECVADQIENIGKSFMSKAGIERDFAAKLLARFYARHDTAARFPKFLGWSETTVQAADIFQSLGVTQVLCEVTKSGGINQLGPHLPRIYQHAQKLKENATLMRNTLLRKFKTKLIGRTGLKQLPPPRRPPKQGRLLTGGIIESDQIDIEADVPEEVESIIEELISTLQDGDTTVRWSASKGLARIAERLPVDFSDQVLENVLGLFSIHTLVAPNGGEIELPAAAEATWHGACLACAEFARRGLIRGRLPELVEWMSKALFFDIRKGAHSIGSNVRDAAAYVLWSLARAQDSHALEPFSKTLAQNLIIASLYDREIHIRRAASAAFQENVGRMGLFPHGIDVLRKTDFYAVSIRRNAFTIAAPQVAEHEVYRQPMLDQLLQVTLKHWDANMRTSGAQSLRLVCEIDLPKLGSPAAIRVAKLLQSVDGNEVHGALLALAELAAAFRDAGMQAAQREVFAFLSTIPPLTLQKHRNEFILEAACLLISNGISTEVLASDSSEPLWKNIVDLSLKHRNDTVQIAAAAALASFPKATPGLQRGLARVLGRLAYDCHPHGVKEALYCLLDVTKVIVPGSVETRRNCYVSMETIIKTLNSRVFQDLEPIDVQAVYRSFLNGLNDYSVDERGDVGSWVRMACIKGVSSITLALLQQIDEARVNELHQWLPPQIYHEALGTVLKQGVERLDNVRGDAGTELTNVLTFWNSTDVQRQLGTFWQPHGLNLLVELFLGPDSQRWSDGAWLFPRAVRTLEIKEYRQAVLKGLILSAGGRNDSTQRPIATSLTAYVESLPALVGSGAYSVQELTTDINALTKGNLGSNNVIMPILNTIEVILEAGAGKRLSEAGEEGLKPLRDMLSFTGKGVERLKNVHRILACMKIVVALAVVPGVSGQAIQYLPNFLGHAFPKVRAETAEHLYLTCQMNDMGEGEEELEGILLGTSWLTEGDLRGAVEQVVNLLGQV